MGGTLFNPIQKEWHGAEERGLRSQAARDFNLRSTTFPLCDLGNLLTFLNLRVLIYKIEITIVPMSWAGWEEPLT